MDMEKVLNELEKHGWVVVKLEEYIRLKSQLEYYSVKLEELEEQNSQLQLKLRRVERLLADLEDMLRDLELEVEFLKDAQSVSLE